MSALKRGEPLEALLKRAKMDKYKFNTGVVRGTDKALRIAVNSAIVPEFGDCVAVGFMAEADPTGWRYTHISPARARVLAKHLLDRAALLEGPLHLDCIDNDKGETA